VKDKVYKSNHPNSYKLQFSNRQRPEIHWNQIYNTLALPILLYGSENLTMTAKDKTRITAAELKFMEEQRNTLGWTIKQTTAC
jgi:hypothetical protein